MRAFASLTGLALDAGDGGITRAAKLRARFAVGRGSQCRRDIFDVLQNFRLRTRALFFFRGRGGEESVLRVIVIGRGQVAHAALDAMMIGQDEPAR